MSLTVFLMGPSGVVSTVVPDSAHKLFIGGLPNYLNDDQVSIFEYAVYAPNMHFLFQNSVNLPKQ